MKRGRNTLLPDEKSRRSFRNFCLALAKGDQSTAKKELDNIEAIGGKGELWNGFLWGLNGMYDASARKDERATFVMAYSRLMPEEIRKIVNALREEEKALFITERERGVFEANIYALDAIAEAIEKGQIKRELPGEAQEGEQTTESSDDEVVEANEVEKEGDE